MARKPRPTVSVDPTDLMIGPTFKALDALCVLLLACRAAEMLSRGLFATIAADAGQQLGRLLDAGLTPGTVVDLERPLLDALRDAATAYGPISDARVLGLLRHLAAQPDARAVVM